MDRLAHHHPPQKIYSLQVKIGGGEGGRGGGEVDGSLIGSLAFLDAFCDVGVMQKCPNAEIIFGRLLVEKQILNVKNR
jgi:hypothetical protein